MKQILVIDDSPAAFDMIRSLLAPQGYEVIAASSAEDGINEASSRKPSAVIIDIAMPPTDGYDVCRRLREDKELADTRIVIVAGETDIIDSIKARQVYADKVIVKSEDMSILVKTVKKLSEQKTVMVVDDNPATAGILKSLLEESGCRALVFSTGADGVKEAANRKLDLVIVDTNLPDIDGFEVCRWVKESEGSARPKVIMITGSVDATDAVKARQMGADDYVVKTSDFSLLMEAVKKLI